MGDFYSYICPQSGKIEESIFNQNYYEVNGIG